MSKKRYVVECYPYGYWQNTGYCLWAVDLRNCDKFRFWITAFFAYFDQIVNGDGEIKKVEI